MTDEQRMQILAKCLDTLKEHFSTVQIFVTRELDGEDEVQHDGAVDAGDTASYSVGSGNWFARLGQVADWKMTQEHREKVRINAQMLRDAEEGEEK